MRLVLVRLLTASVLGMVLLERPVLDFQAGARTHVLPPATSRLSQSYNRVLAIRELPDGRALMATRDSAVPLLADFQSGVVTPVGRTGSGPGEFREVRSILALGGDSSLVDDQQNARWSILAGARFVRSHPTWRVGWYGPRLAGADTSGGVLELVPIRYGAQAGVQVNQIPQNAESVLVVRHQRALAGSVRAIQRTDTIVRLRGAFRGVRRVQRRLGPDPGKGVGAWFELRAILAGDDQALLFPDGWIAVAWQEPYRVDWRSPVGTWQRGSPLPFVRVPVDEAQRRAAVSREWPRSPDLFAPGDFPSWPRFLPPFLGDALLALPDGRLAVRRTADGRSNEVVYDLIDRNGMLTGRLVVPGNTILLAPGRDALYVLVRDQDDLERVSRHPWPPVTRGGRESETDGTRP